MPTKQYMKQQQQQQQQQAVTTSSNCSAVWEIFVQLIGKSPDESFSGTYNMLILFLLIPILPTKQ
jgi:hypothetical protein